VKLSYALLLLPALAHGAWRPVPANLWVMQAAVPPGTNNTQVVQPVIPGVGGAPVAPIGPNGGVSGSAVFPNSVGAPVPVGTPVQGGPPPPPGSAPVTPGGRFQPLPPGVVPAGQPSSTAPGSPPASPSPAGVTNVPVTASAVSKLPTCEVTLRLSRTEIPPVGGEFTVPAVRQPVNCPASIAISAPWLATTDASGLQFTAEPNNTGATRDTLIVIGGRSFFVRQSPPAQLGLAAAPGRLVFGINRKGEADTKILTAWTEQPSGSFVAKPQHSWLVVTPTSSKEHRQTFNVTVKAGAGLPPGRHDTQIEISAAGAPERSITIPVVVEVTRPN
jgi:hypothetical protein